MNLTDSFTLKCLCGSPIFLDDICAIYPATLREIVSLGYDTFWQYLQVLIAENVIVGNIPETYYNLEGLTNDDVMEVMQ